MPIELTKNITIDGREFQVGRVPANVGQWIVVQIDRFSDEAVFNKARNYLFNACSYIKQVDGAPVPMKMYHDGKWLLPDLEYDLETVSALFREAFDFNFGPFLKRRLEEMEAESSREQAINL